MVRLDHRMSMLCVTNDKNWGNCNMTKYDSTSRKCIYIAIIVFVLLRYIYTDTN